MLRVIILIVFTTFSFSQAVTAAPARAITVKFDILSVIENKSVTIRTRDFPQKTKFSVLMGRATQKAIDAFEAGAFDSGAGGVVDATFPIPAELEDIRIIGIRIESADGYAAYNWFFNRTQTNLIPDEKAAPSLSFSGVQKDQAVTVAAANLLPRTEYRVRVGPYYTFYRDYIAAGTVTSDDSGRASLTIALDENEKVQEAEFISVRLDGGGQYVFDTFSNIDGGKQVPASQLYKVIPCTLLSINPVPALSAREEWDAVWTVQNTSLSAWDSRRTVFKYLGGAKMQKRGDIVYLPYTVERGWTVHLGVDMIAPEDPGWHRTTWGLVNRDNQVICQMNITVFVQE